MPLGLVPHISPPFAVMFGDRRVRCCTCCTTIAATVVDSCALLTSSTGKISSQRERIDLVPSKKAYYSVSGKIAVGYLWKDRAEMVLPVKSTRFLVL